MMVAEFNIARVLCALILACTISVGLGEFSYGTKLLDKMIRMEIKMEQIEGRIHQTREAIYAAQKKLDLTLDNKTAELRELEGRVDVPLIAFFATNPQDQSLNTAQKLILQTVALNLGQGYDRHLGQFTAPVAGLYQFVAHICGYSSNAFYYYMMLNGTVIHESTKYNTGTHDCASSSVITQVKEGQLVWIESAKGNPNVNQLYESSYFRSSFSGVLLHK